MVAKIYCGCCSEIDRHNRCRQDDLQLERKLGTHDWSTRVNHLLFGIRVVEAWQLYRAARGPAASFLQALFYAKLASELIENTQGVTSTRMRTGLGGVSEHEPDLADGVDTHLQPTAKRLYAWKDHSA